MNNTTEIKAFSANENGIGPGAYLKGVRAKKNVSREYIQSQLGLTGTLFCALENDDILRLPGPVYVRGYLRRYAELVGERAAPVLSKYQTLLEREGLVDVPTEEPSQRPIKVMVGSALAMLLATSLVFGAILSETEVLSEIEEPVAITLPVQKDSSQPEVVTVEQLRLSFVTDSWVEVVDSRDHILAVSLQREGNQLDLEGKPPFTVTLGYGPGVSVSYLGERIAFDHDPETFASRLVVGK